ncbi:Fic family protein [Desulfitobacterium metallireducens]|uniref:Cell filamentation protein Fic n=1 Tax=Desulfitobacterium metallireducens DSM 15288 TaxID=871968 RepID=W0ECL9_9FIRM|nr:Fic family protein [Desulfitobacterium metallireducens]AHF07253.1 cell filamentation protein Fic [Desulfitobacterium metallireducens DSM 15288]
MDIYRLLDLYKVNIDERRPFEGEMLKQLQAYYRIGLTWSSNALEGNTLTESETKVLLEDGLTIGGKPLRYTFEAIGHAKAYDFMFTLLKKRTITESDVFTMHRMFYASIESEYAGKYRDIDAFISGSKYPVAEPKRIQKEMDALFQWIEAEREKLHPVVFAAQLHKRFAFIHPFKEGNGRIARLIMNTALIQDGYMLAVIPPILRHEYIQLLEKAHRDELPFEEFIAERVIESEKEIMRLLHIHIPKL